MKRFSSVIGSRHLTTEMLYREMHSCTKQVHSALPERAEGEKGSMLICCDVHFPCGFGINVFYSQTCSSLCTHHQKLLRHIGPIHMAVDIHQKFATKFSSFFFFLLLLFRFRFDVWCCTSRCICKWSLIYPFFYSQIFRPIKVFSKHTQQIICKSRLCGVK